MESRSDVLFRRIQTGDREAAAEFVLLYGPQIRRRIRGRLGRRLRRAFDTQDILSTLLRRLDQFVLQNDLRATSDAQMWALVARIAETAIREKGRHISRRKRRDDVDAFGGSAAARAESPDQDTGSSDLDISDVFELVENPMDQQILSMWLAGRQHEVSAQVLGLSPMAVRKRWERLKERLRTGLLERTR